jgi:hypothetical protein
MEGRECSCRQSWAHAHACNAVVRTLQWVGWGVASEACLTSVAVQNMLARSSIVSLGGVGTTADLNAHRGGTEPWEDDY